VYLENHSQNITTTRSLLSSLYSKHRKYLFNVLDSLYNKNFASHHSDGLGVASWIGNGMECRQVSKVRMEGEMWETCIGRKKMKSRLCHKTQINCNANYQCIRLQGNAIRVGY